MRHIKVLLLLFAVAAAGLTGCLKKNDANIDVSNLTAPVYTLEWIQNGGTTVNAGLQYFANGALTYPASHTSDTTIFAVRLTGTQYPNSDVTVTIAPDTKALLDNFSVDGITYDAMPDSLFKILNTTAVIPKGTGVAFFKVVFYPSKINATKNYMLAPTVTSPTDYKVSANFGHVYFHTIGNPIAGSYFQEYIRIPSQDPNANPDTHVTNRPITFAPQNPTTVSAPTGYYTAPDYWISFKNTNGVLSNFTVVFSAKALSDFAGGGITIIQQPTIVVSADLKKFTLNYIVFNGSAYRNVTDIYTKP